MAKRDRNFMAGDFVESGMPNTEDYDQGHILEIENNMCRIGWQSGAQTWTSPKGLRFCKRARGEGFLKREQT